MAGYNKIILMGNLTREPDYKQLKPGSQPVCRLSVASNRQFRNKQSGDMVQEVCFIDVDVWGPQAESCRQYLAKGRPVLIEGRIKFDSWQDQEGKTRSKHSIVAERVIFLSSASDQTDQSTTEADQGNFEPRNDVERELMSQLDDIKNRKTDFGAAKSARPAAKSGFGASKPQSNNSISQDLAATFKDEPPFQDDLPF